MSHNKTFSSLNTYCLNHDFLHTIIVFFLSAADNKTYASYNHFCCPWENNYTRRLPSLCCITLRSCVQSTPRRLLLLLLLWSLATEILAVISRVLSPWYLAVAQRNAAAWRGARKAGETGSVPVSDGVQGPIRRYKQTPCPINVSLTVWGEGQRGVNCFFFVPPPFTDWRATSSY